MLKNKVIFILSLMRFDGLNSSNFTVAKYLAKNNSVYYMEHPMTWKDYLKADRQTENYKIRKNAIKISSNGLLQKKIEGVNILLSHPVFPVDFLPKGALFNFFHSLNERSIANRINSVIKEKKIGEYFFINAYEFQYPTVVKFLSIKPELSVYYCVDPIPDYHKKHGTDLERKLVKNSDLVICTSEWLYREKKELNKNTCFVPNGSDLVRETDLTSLEPHEMFKSIGKPVVGFLGAIERRIDYELIRNVAKQNPGLLFLFVGPVSGAPDWFFDMENIKIMPPVSYNEVAQVIKGFDVCMIPFKKDEISSSIFPLKLFEYLGIGKPVVITNFNEDLRDFTGDLVEFSATPEEFSSAIKFALEENNEDLINERIALARKNTWQKRVDMIEEIIGQNFQR